MQVTIKYANPPIEGYTVHLSPTEAWELLRVLDPDWPLARPLRALREALKNAGVGAV